MNSADLYAGMRRDEGCSSIEERLLFSSVQKSGELEIQARWFAGEFGSRFKTTDGASVEIVQFGVWNREAGPDFVEAAVSIGGGSPMRGSIELDPEARDWERHGHATNPDYESVVLHVVLHRGEAAFFTRTAQNRNVPQVVLDISGLRGELPNPVPATRPGGCAASLRGFSGKIVGAIIESAAQFRMRKRAARLSRLIEVHGPDEALYQALATTMGYKSNKLPFTVIAQRLPLRTLLQHKPEAEALIFGISGFLGTSDLAQFDRETRSYLRELWEKWWARRGEYERLALDRKEWRLSGQRPVNHPQRRLAGLAQMVKHWARIRALSQNCDVKAIEKFFEDLSDEYWDAHYTLVSRKSPTRMALVGESRVADMLANVFFPIAILSEPARWSDYVKLPARLGNRSVEIAASRLFGETELKKQMKGTLARQQGLLQIAEDFCMQDDSGCVRCLFPRQMAQWG